MNYGVADKFLEIFFKLFIVIGKRESLKILLKENSSFLALKKARQQKFSETLTRTVGCGAGGSETSFL